MFVLTSQIALSAPSMSEIQQVRNTIERGLGDLVVNINVKSGPGAAQYIKEANSITVVNKKVSSSSQEAAETMDEFGRRAGLAAKRFLAFTAATSLFIVGFRQIKSSISTLIDFEEQILKIGQVSGRTLGSLNNLRADILKISKDTGVASKELAQAGVILSQSSFAVSRLREAIQAIAEARLGPTFGDIQEISEVIVAVENQFKNKTGKIREYLSQINTVAAQFPVEAKDLITAIRTAGGSFEVAGGQLEDLLAVFSAVRSTTRESAESISTSLRTIVARIGRTETVDFFFKKFNANLTFTENGVKKLLPPLEAFAEISKALNKIPSQSLLFKEAIEVIAGTRLQSKAIPIVKQLELALDIKNVAEEAKKQDTIAKDAAKALDTLGNAMTRTKEAFNDMNDAFLRDTTLRTFLGLVLSTVRATTELAKSLAPLTPLIGIVSSASAINVGRSVVKPFLSQVPILRSPQKFATGGIVPGSGGGDRVPALLTPGEVILNKSQQIKLGLATGLNPTQIFKQIGVPGFADGGIIGKKPKLNYLEVRKPVDFSLGSIIDQNVSQRLQALLGVKNINLQRPDTNARLAEPGKAVEVGTKMVEEAFKQLGLSMKKYVSGVVEITDETKAIAKAAGIKPGGVFNQRTKQIELSGTAKATTPLHEVGHALAFAARGTSKEPVENQRVIASLLKQSSFSKIGKEAAYKGNVEELFADFFASQGPEGRKALSSAIRVGFKSNALIGPGTKSESGLIGEELQNDPEFTKFLSRRAKERRKIAEDLSKDPDFTGYTPLSKRRRVKRERSQIMQDLEKDPDFINFSSGLSLEKKLNKAKTLPQSIPIRLSPKQAIEEFTGAINTTGTRIDQSSGLKLLTGPPPKTLRSGESGFNPAFQAAQQNFIRFWKTPSVPATQGSRQIPSRSLNISRATENLESSRRRSLLSENLGVESFVTPPRQPTISGTVQRILNGMRIRGGSISSRPINFSEKSILDILGGSGGTGSRGGFFGGFGGNPPSGPGGPKDPNDPDWWLKGNFSGGRSGGFGAFGLGGPSGPRGPGGNGFGSFFSGGFNRAQGSVGNFAERLGNNSPGVGAGIVGLGVAGLIQEFKPLGEASKDVSSFISRLITSFGLLSVVLSTSRKTVEQVTKVEAARGKVTEKISDISRESERISEDQFRARSVSDTRDVLKEEADVAASKAAQASEERRRNRKVRSAQISVLSEDISEKTRKARETEGIIRGLEKGTPEAAKLEAERKARIARNAQQALEIRAGQSKDEDQQKFLRSRAARFAENATVQENIAAGLTGVSGQDTQEVIEKKKEELKIQKEIINEKKTEKAQIKEIADRSDARRAKTEALAKKEANYTDNLVRSEQKKLDIINREVAARQQNVTKLTQERLELEKAAALEEKRLARQRGFQKIGIAASALAIAGGSALQDVGSKNINAGKDIGVTQSSIGGGLIGAASGAGLVAALGFGPLGIAIAAAAGALLNFSFTAAEARKQLAQVRIDKISGVVDKAKSEGRGLTEEEKAEILNNARSNEQFLGTTGTLPKIEKLRSQGFSEERVKEITDQEKLNDYLNQTYRNPVQKFILRLAGRSNDGTNLTKTKVATEETKGTAKQLFDALDLEAKNLGTIRGNVDAGISDFLKKNKNFIDQYAELMGDGSKELIEKALTSAIKIDQARKRNIDSGFAVANSFNKYLTDLGKFVTSISENIEKQAVTRSNLSTQLGQFNEIESSNILNNPLTSDRKEFERVALTTGASLGRSKEAQQLSDFLPVIDTLNTYLDNLPSQDVSAAKLESEIETIFQNMGKNNPLSQQTRRDLEDFLGLGGSEENIDLARKNIQEGKNKIAQSLNQLSQPFEAFNKLLNGQVNNLRKNLNDVNALFEKFTQGLISRAEITLQGQEIISSLTGQKVNPANIQARNNAVLAARGVANLTPQQIGQNIFNNQQRLAQVRQILTTGQKQGATGPIPIDIQDRQQLANEEANLIRSTQNLTQGLEVLANVSLMTAAAQEKVRQEEEKRLKKRDFELRKAIGTPEEQLAARKFESQLEQFKGTGAAAKFNTLSNNEKRTFLDTLSSDFAEQDIVIDGQKTTGTKAADFFRGAALSKAGLEKEDVGLKTATDLVNASGRIPQGLGRGADFLQREAQISALTGLGISTKGLNLGFGSSTAPIPQASIDAQLAASGVDSAEFQARQDAARKRVENEANRTLTQVLGGKDVNKLSQTQADRLVGLLQQRGQEQFKFGDQTLTGAGLAEEVVRRREAQGLLSRRPDLKEQEAVEEAKKLVEPTDVSSVVQAINTAKDAADVLNQQVLANAQGAAVSANQAFQGGLAQAQAASAQPAGAAFNANLQTANTQLVGQLVGELTKVLPDAGKMAVEFGKILNEQVTNQIADAGNKFLETSNVLSDAISRIPDNLAVQGAVTLNVAVTGLQGSGLDDAAKDVVIGLIRAELNKFIKEKLPGVGRK